MNYDGKNKINATLEDKVSQEEREALAKSEKMEQERKIKKENTSDNVENPPHYKAHPSGIECIQVTEHMGFNLGNAVKYIWRCDDKNDAIEDLEKARWYIDREIKKRLNDNDYEYTKRAVVR